MLSDLLDCLSLSVLYPSYSLCLSIGLLNKGSITNPSNNQKKGFVKLNGKKELITGSELETLISEFKQKAKDTYDKNKLSPSYLLILRSFINGVFQAEGSWSGQFNSKSSYKFNPKFSIGQNVSTESLQFLSMMWAILGCNLVWNISKTQANNFHIQLVSTNRAYIVSTLIPYFSLIYGDKFEGLAKILRLNELANMDTLAAKIESVHLAYSLSPLGKDPKISLKEKLGFVTEKYKSTTDKLIAVVNLKFPGNNVPMDLSFLLGFFLGDGSLYIRIRDNRSGLNFIPKFEIKQRYTDTNANIMELICKFLQSKGIQANLRSSAQYVLCVVEGTDHVCNSLIPLLNTHKELFFWKAFQLKLTEQFGKLVNLDCRNLYHVNYLIIKTLYSIDNNRDLPIEHWFKRIDDIFKNKAVKNISGELYISPINDKVNKTGQIGWSVFLPEFLNIKPRTKYFFFASNGGKDIALEEAVSYRDSVINNWLLNQGYNIDPLDESE